MRKLRRFVNSFAPQTQLSRRESLNGHEWNTRFECILPACAGISHWRSAHNHPKCDAERTRSFALTATCACVVVAVAVDFFVRADQVNESLSSDSDSFCARRVSFLVSALALSRISILLAFRVCGCLPLLVLKRSYKQTNSQSLRMN